jgi:exodeoxyribonuclease V alpha subunit
MHRGLLGTISLNTALQERLNPARLGAGELTRGERVFRLGDKVMQIKNDYDKNVFNGDIGLIARVPEGDEPLVLELPDGRRADYERTELDQLAHAYAVSVHKSQGSEYPCVVIPLVTQHFMMLQRNLLYTAITRGKELVVIVGSRRAVAMAVRNQSTRERFTWLAERIRAAAA